MSLTETAKFTADNKPVLAMGEKAYHSREGNALHRYADDMTPGADAVVLSGTTMVYNIASGYQVFVTGVTHDMETVSDDIQFTLVRCTEVDGQGTATQLVGDIHAFTSTAVGGGASRERYFTPPIRVRYSPTVRSISLKLDANDASAKCSCGWFGWTEAQ